MRHTITSAGWSAGNEAEKWGQKDERAPSRNHRWGLTELNEDTDFTGLHNALAWGVDVAIV